MRYTENLTDPSREDVLMDSWRGSKISLWLAVVSLVVSVVAVGISALSFQRSVDLDVKFEVLDVYFEGTEYSWGVFGPELRELEATPVESRKPMGVTAKLVNEGLSLTSVLSVRTRLSGGFRLAGSKALNCPVLVDGVPPGEAFSLNPRVAVQFTIQFDACLGEMIEGCSDHYQKLEIVVRSSDRAGSPRTLYLGEFYGCR